MGRKSKPPVTLKLSSAVNTLVPLNDDLPDIVSYLDIWFERTNAKHLTRVFLKKPTQSDIANTLEIRQTVGSENFSVVGAMMPYLMIANKVKPSVYEYCENKKLSTEFTETLIRLVIMHFKGVHAPSGGVSIKMRSIRNLIDFVSIWKANPSTVTIEELGKDFWLDFLSHLESRTTRQSQTFYDVRSIFDAYAPTSLNGWLSQLTYSEPITEEDFSDDSYSDAVMYQILALCIEGFQRRIGYLKRAEHLTESDMPLDWLYPGRKNGKLADGTSRRRNDKNIPLETESFRLLREWLNDEDEGYQILIDHFILHYRSGLIRYGGDKKKYIGGIIGSLMGLSNRKVLLPELQKFYCTTASWHGFEYPSAGRTIWGFYVKKKKANEVNLVQNQITWCLANLLMMQTGVNKEVALSIPSLGEDGKSILLRSDTLFTNEDGISDEIELYGFKEKVGSSRKKTVTFSIVKDSPLYEMLVDYERYFKLDSNGPFFEFNKHFGQAWSKAGGMVDFLSVYPIFDENGEQVTSVITKKFRKVFASGQLLDRIKNIKNANDLAEKIREDLNHGSLDTTLTHYLLKTNIGLGVIDTAIATITSDRLAEAIKFKGQIPLTENVKVKKTVYMCDCEDPTNPSHDVSIAAECKHYDLCLGCERSVVTKDHLPYICTRILQYEKERLIDPNIWPATFENLWCIALDTLDQYVAKDKLNGQRYVDEAWELARTGQISLPPIINSNKL